MDDHGDIRARYDKIHLFDVDLSETERYRESAVINPGNQAVVTDTPWGRLGMTTCYDLRFPHLYRALARPAPKSWRFPRLSPRSPDRPTGTCSTAPAPSRTAPWW